MNELTKEDIIRIITEGKNGKTTELFNIVRVRLAVEELKKRDYVLYQEIGKLLKDIHPGVMAKVAVKLMRLQKNRDDVFSGVKK